MGKFFKVLSLNLTIILLTALFFVGGECAEVNGENVNPGDKVTFEIYVNSYPRKIQGVDAVIYYDSASFEIIEGSLELPNLNGFLINPNIPGEIRFNSISVEGYDFSDGGILASVSFKTIDTSSENMNISCTIKSFLDEDKIDLMDTLTYSRTYVMSGLNTAPGAESKIRDVFSESDSSAVSVNSEQSSSVFVSEQSEGSELTSSENEHKRIRLNIFDAEETDTVKSEIPNETNDADEHEIQTTHGGVSYRSFEIILISAVGVVFLIGIIFVVVLKSTKKKNH